MLLKEDLQEILNIALRNGGDFAEIFIENTISNSILCEDNKMERIVSGVDQGVGLRLVQGLNTFYAASTDSSLEALKSAAIALSSNLSGNPKICNDLVPQISDKTSTILKRPNLISIEEKIEQVKILNSSARKFDQIVKQVTIRYADTNQGVTIANSDGVYVEDNRIRSRYFINVIAEKDGVLQTGYEAPGGTVGFELFDLYPPEKIAQMAAERAVRLISAPHAPAGKMMVVISAEAGGTLIHEACGHALEADFIMKGTSVFCNRLEKMVASPLITVIDDTTLVQKFGSYSFDDEGTQAQRTVLIENGVLKGYLSDRITAKALGIKPSGNGRRETFRSKPIPRMTNTMIASGKTDPAEIVNSVKNGLLIKRMGGGEVNVTNGNFVFEINEGYLIENGKIKYPVKGATLTGNGPKVLESVDMVGSDLGFQVGICGKYDHAPVADAQPTIRIQEIIVGGI